MWILAAVAAGYQLLALMAALVFLMRSKAAPQKQAPQRKAAAAVFVQKEAAASCGAPKNTPGPVSILKPLRGLDPGFREAIGSHVALDGEKEILCGIRGSDPAVEVLREFPAVRAVSVTTDAPNGKVGALIDLVREARFPLLVVNDSDIRVEPDYLRRVTAPLADPNNGLVTCLYRPEGATFAARFEGLGISTDFAPSTLVARLLGVNEFAMGSTLALRRADLERIGGFEALRDYIADDYQLGHRIHGLGLACVLSEVVVSTGMAGSWTDVWRHQVRWARTIRVSKPAGYAGLPVTFATLWAMVEALGGRWDLAVIVLAARMAMALVAGWGVLRSSDVLRLWPLIPVRDLYGAVVWAAGLVGRTVWWRGIRMRLDAQGRIR